MRILAHTSCEPGFLSVLQKLCPTKEHHLSGMECSGCCLSAKVVVCSSCMKKTCMDFCSRSDVSPLWRCPVQAFAPLLINAAKKNGATRCENLSTHFLQLAGGAHTFIGVLTRHTGKDLSTVLTRHTGKVLSTVLVVFMASAGGIRVCLISNAVAPCDNLMPWSKW